MTLVEEYKGDGLSGYEKIYVCGRVGVAKRIVYFYSPSDYILQSLPEQVFHRVYQPCATLPVENSFFKTGWLSLQLFFSNARKSFQAAVRVISRR